jgi:predicted dehydrogenase
MADTPFSTGGPVPRSSTAARLVELDHVVCPGCGADEHLDAIAVSGAGWTCGGCSYHLEQGRPPTLGELMAEPGGFGEWDEVDISAYVRKIVVLMAAGADRLNAGAARTLGFQLAQAYPGLGNTLMPQLMQLLAAR